MKTTATVSERKSTGSLQYRDNFWDFYLTNREYVDNLLYKTAYKTMAAWGVKHIPVEDVVSDVMGLLRTRRTVERYDPKRKASLTTYIIGCIRGYTRHVLDAEMHHMKLVPNISVCRESAEVTYHDHTIDVTDMYQSIRSVLSDQEIVVFNMVVLGYTGVEIAEKFEKTPTWASLKLKAIRDHIRSHMELTHA